MTGLGTPDFVMTPDHFGPSVRFRLYELVHDGLRGRNVPLSFQAVEHLRQADKVGQSGASQVLEGASLVDEQLRAHAGAM